MFLRSGTGEDQCRLVTDYDGTNKIVTVSDDWTVVPDTTTGYTMLPNHIPTPADILSGVETGLVTYGTAKTTDITSLNNISSEDVETAVVTGLGIYDGATETDIEEAVEPLATESELTTINEKIDLVLSTGIKHPSIVPGV